MEEELESKQLHRSAASLKNTAAEINKKIKEQSVVIETIQNESKASDDKFTKNNRGFDEALEKYDSDNRNVLLIALIILIIVLVYYIKSK